MKWTEQDAKDAARLLERLEQRAKRETLAGGVRGPAQIANPAFPLLDKRADGESDKGVGTLNRRPQLTDSREELAGGYKERCGQVVDNRKCRPSEGVEGRSIACPLTETDTIASGFTVPDLNGNASRRGLG